MALVKALTENGWVRGVPAGAQSVSVFRAVPFAAPPTGDLRWARPQRHEDWDGELDCTCFSDIPWQRRIPKDVFLAKEFYPFDWDRSEDCLYLNIWTPAKSADEKLPVAMWIFGGGNFQGYGHKQEFDGEAYARRGVVYVSVNYRLNVFGFLAHPELTAEQGGASGNYGLLDQVAALEWIQRNIAAFGGDPDNVTIFGQSAGGGNTKMLSCSPLAKGLVKRAIISSSGAFGDGDMTLENAEKIGTEFFERFGIKDLAAARQIPAEELFEMHQTFISEKKVFGTCFRPNVDGYFLTEQTNDTLARGDLNPESFMVGSTRDESIPEHRAEGTVAQVREWLAAKIGEEFVDPFIEAYGIKEDADVADFNEHQFAVFMTVTQMLLAEQQLKNGNRPVYHYQFNQPIPGEPQIGIYHSCEHVFLNQTLMRNGRPYSGADFDLSNDMNSYWCNFIATGDPNGKRVNGDDLPEWKPVTEDGYYVMSLKTNPELMKDPFGEPVKIALEGYKKKLGM